MTISSDQIYGSGDFFELLKRSGYSPQQVLSGIADNGTLEIPQGTTVLAFHYKSGIIVAGDRRATAGNAIMYERCDKVIPIDDHSLMAVAGVPATAFEMARILSHNFEYYRRSQLRIMSTEGKVRALSKLLKDNVALALQGVGAVSPLFATYDQQQEKLFLYFYDMLGAEFQILTHVATGSGSPMIRGVLEHENLWGTRPLKERSQEEAMALSIRLLQTAAQFDSATGQARPEDKLFPIIAKITKDGYQFVSDDEMESIYKSSMKRS